MGWCKSSLLQEAETVVKLGMKSWFGDVGPVAPFPTLEMRHRVICGLQETSQAEALDRASLTPMQGEGGHSKRSICRTRNSNTLL